MRSRLLRRVMRRLPDYTESSAWYGGRLIRGGPFSERLRVPERLESGIIVMNG